MAKRRLWELPELNYEEERGEHRNVTWLELFFDLFFVASIAQLAHGLGKHPSWGGVAEFSILFIPIWWIWIGYTYYNERFESYGLEQRFFTFLLMLPIIGLAFFGHHGIEKGFSGFVFSYAAARAVLIAVWLRATLYVLAFRPVGIPFIIGCIISLVLTLIAALIDNKLFAYCLFGIAIALDVLTPLATSGKQAKLPRLSTTKLPERFGLFVIVVLGEMVVGVVNGLADVTVEQLSLLLFCETALAVVLGVGLWWIYFDFIGRRPPVKGIALRFAWSYLHLPLVMAIVATGASISSVIGGTEEFSGELRQIIASAVGVFLFAVACLETTLHRQDGEPTHKYFSPLSKLLAGFLSLAAGWADIINDFFSLLLVLLALLSCQVVYGVWVWFRDNASIGRQIF
ncbi:MAG: low temperature requirement protein A [Planctomycetes bacterium]|nr:low temperature requirement protein A [Planctomycetota bacterium]